MGFPLPLFTSRTCNPASAFDVQDWIEMLLVAYLLSLFLSEIPLPPLPLPPLPLPRSLPFVQSWLSVLVGPLLSRSWRPLHFQAQNPKLISEAKSTLFSVIGLLSRPLGSTGWLHYSRTSSLT